MIKAANRTFTHRPPDKYICKLCFSAYDSKGKWYQAKEWFTIPYKWNIDLYHQYQFFYEGVGYENFIASRVWKKLGYKYDKVKPDYDSTTTAGWGLPLYADYYVRYELHDEFKEQLEEVRSKDYGRHYYNLEEEARMKYQYHFFHHPKHYRPMQDMYYVGEFFVHEHYGGPEEGGWWYSTNELTHWTTFPNIKAAEDWCKGRNKYLKHTNPDRFAKTMILPMTPPVERPMYE